MPAVEYAGQGGFGDVVLHPDFAANGLVYLSYAEEGERGTAGAAVARARLVLEPANAPALEGLAVIWRQNPKVDGRGHYGHRIAFGPDGFLYISSGERQKFTPAQDLQQNLGKIVRLADDGSVPRDNPFAGRGGVADADLVARAPQSARARVRRERPALERGDGAARRRRAQPRAARRQLRLPRRLERRSLQRRRRFPITTPGPNSTRRRCFGTP